MTRPAVAASDATGSRATSAQQTEIGNRPSKTISHSIGERAGGGSRNFGEAEQVQCRLTKISRSKHLSPSSAHGEPNTLAYRIEALEHRRVVGIGFAAVGEQMFALLGVSKE